MTDLDDRAVGLNFSWLEGGLVAGCRAPRTDADLMDLFELGIRALVRLASEEETGLVRRDVERHGIRDFYEPVSDFTAPSQEQLDRIVDFIQASINQGDLLAVSCGAGMGRTGTVLACYLAARGLPGETAIEMLIGQRPCCVELRRVPGQEAAVLEFSKRPRPKRT